MRNITNIIRNILLCILAAFLSVSCMLEKDGPSVGRRSVMIQMSVSVEAMTRAGATEDATEAEKAIGSLRVYAFHGQRLAGYAVRQATALGEPFYMDLRLPENGVHDVDFYLVANEDEMAFENGLVQLSENMTREQLEALKFTGLAKAEAMPMYCRHMAEPINVDAVSEVANTEEGHEGHYILQNPVEFVLERSLAKISVYAARISGASMVPQVLGVELLAQGTREYSYLFPQSDAVLDQVNPRMNNRVLSSSATDIVSEVEKGSSAAAAPEEYTMVVDGVYMPEVRVGLAYDDPGYDWSRFTGTAADADRAAVMHVEYTLGAGQDRRNGYIYLPRIERNHHYKVCILINAEGQIILNYVVADWDWDTDRMQDWFFDYPTHTYLLHEIPLDEEGLHVSPPERAMMSETVPFTGYFRMTYPQNDQWMPTLEGLNASNCDIRVYRIDDGMTSTQVTPPLGASENWYRIEVWPKSGYLSPEDKVNLAITYTPSGLTEIEYLLVNGSSSDYFWPESFSENYVTITMVN